MSHEEGSYPELDDQVLSEFAVGVAQLSPSQAMLITDKFSPVFDVRARASGQADDLRDP